MTYGDLKFRITKAFPGMDLDLIEGWINDRYAEILGELPWGQQDYQAMLQTTAPYSAGTVAVTQGSNAITLTGGAWTNTMVGMSYRSVGRHEFYALTFQSPTTGTLDRPYEGPTAAATAYSIWQSIYLLPSDCRLLQDGAFDDMRRWTHGEANQSDPFRVATGRPEAWSSYMDDNSTPPLMQVELWPIPQIAKGIPFTYQGQAAGLVPLATSTILQIWMQPAALVEGVTARAKAHLKDYPGAQFHAVLAKAALETMKRAEAQGMAPAKMTLDPYYTHYRMRRGNR